MKLSKEKLFTDIKSDNMRYLFVGSIEGRDFYLNKDLDKVYIIYNNTGSFNSFYIEKVIDSCFEALHIGMIEIRRRLPKLMLLK